MKKRVMSMLLAFIMILGIVPGTAFAADSVEEALGEVDIYDGGTPLSYLSINGRVRELIYTYYNYVNRNGQTKEIPAYCVNPNIMERYALFEWNDALEYLCGEPPQASIIAARDALLKALRSVKQALDFC